MIFFLNQKFSSNQLESTYTYLNKNQTEAHPDLKTSIDFP
jgi:hypothetical protein